MGLTNHNTNFTCLEKYPIPFYDSNPPIYWLKTQKKIKPFCFPHIHRNRYTWLKQKNGKEKARIAAPNIIYNCSNNKFKITQTIEQKLHYNEDYIFIPDKFFKLVIS